MKKETLIIGIFLGAVIMNIYMSNFSILKGDFNQAMNQLANYKCQEQQYEVMEHTCIDTIIRAAGNTTICHGTAMIVNNSLVCDNIECHNTYTYKNFTTGIYSPEENKVICLGEYKEHCYYFLNEPESILSCYYESQKFTLEELGIR